MVKADILCRSCANMSYGRRDMAEYGRMRCVLPTGSSGMVKGECVSFARRSTVNEAPCKGCAKREHPACKSDCGEWEAYHAENERRAYERTVGVDADVFLHEGMKQRVKARGLR